VILVPLVSPHRALLTVFSSSMKNLPVLAGKKGTKKARYIVNTV